MKLEQLDQAIHNTVPSVGGRLTFTITDIAFGGEGVARLDDFVVFVPFVALDEIVEAEITEENDPHRLMVPSAGGICYQ